MIRAKPKRFIKIDNNSELQTSSPCITSSKVAMETTPTTTISIKMLLIIMKMVIIERAIIKMLMMKTITMKSIRISEKIGSGKEEDSGAEVEAEAEEVCMGTVEVGVEMVILEVDKVDGAIEGVEVVVVSLRVLITTIEMVVALMATTNQRAISTIRATTIKRLRIIE